MKRRRWFALVKSIILVSDRRCKPCRKAEDAAERIAEELSVPLTVYPVQLLGKSAEIPITCVVDEAKNKSICFIGYDKVEYENKLRKLLTE